MYENCISRAIARCAVNTPRAKCASQCLTPAQQFAPSMGWLELDMVLIPAIIAGYILGGFIVGTWIRLLMVNHECTYARWRDGDTRRTCVCRWTTFLSWLWPLGLLVILFVSQPRAIAAFFGGMADRKTKKVELQERINKAESEKLKLQDKALQQKIKSLEIDVGL